MSSISNVDVCFFWQETPFGVLSPPLGSSRLKAVETVAALVRVSDDTAERTLMGAGLIPRCLELFLRFPFNNLLHHQARCCSHDD